MEILKQAARLFGYKNKQFETLTEFMIGGAKVRIWRQAKTLEAACAFPHEDYRNAVISVVNHAPMDAWISEIMKLPSVACVAIVDAKGNGISAYPDWG